MTKVVILGGTKGLGFELAKVAMERGCSSNIYGRSSSESNETNKLNEASFYPLDLCDEEGVQNLKFNHPPVQYLFWIAGAFLKNKLVDTSPDVIDNMIRLHYSSPIKFIIKFIKNQGNQPFHLLTVASCSSWRLREDEAIYCSLKSAQATFTRNLAVELARDLPSSKVTLVNPGGLQTQNFWKDVEQDTSEFLDPYKVASIIWDLIQNQKITFQEVQILRKKPVTIGSEPIIEFGPKIPEVMC